MATKNEVLVIRTEQGNAYVIDSALDEPTLDWIDQFRRSLPLDSKRPTVDRRFFESLHMANLLEKPIQDILETSVSVLRYQRFLEYDRLGGHMDPHTDGTKVCDYTRVTSTHTLLLYLTDCQEGGETLLLSNRVKDASPVRASQEDGKHRGILFATKPRRGRLLLFPHATLHAGAPVVDAPKICLRAEVSLSQIES